MWVTHGMAQYNSSHVTLVCWNIGSNGITILVSKLPIH